MFKTSEQHLREKVDAYRLAWEALTGDPSRANVHKYHNACSDLASFVAAHSDVLKFEFKKKDGQ